jgi:hypothetical protein
MLIEMNDGIDNPDGVKSRNHFYLCIEFTFKYNINAFDALEVCTPWIKNLSKDGSKVSKNEQ